MNRGRFRALASLAACLTALVMLVAPMAGHAAELKGGRLRVAILADISNYDPQQFLTINFPIIKNIYDSLIEYTPEGKAVPSLATEWKMGEDNASVTVTLRKDVKFHSGTPFNAQAVAATLAKGADPQKGKNVYATMSFVKDWTVVDDSTIRLNFKGPAPERQMTDLLQFVSVIDPAGIDTVETKPAGTGAYMLGERLVGQRIRARRQPELLAQGRARLEGAGADHLQRRRGRQCGAGIRRGRHRLWRRFAQRGAAEERRLPARPGPRPAGAGVPHQHDGGPVQERQVPSGLQLPDRPRRASCAWAMPASAKSSPCPGRRRARPSTSPTTRNTRSTSTRPSSCSRNPASRRPR